MQFDVLTLFPEMFEILNESIIGRAKEKELININLINIRDFSKNKHKKVDDTPYGGGAGMVMQPDVVYDAYKSVKDEKAKVIYMSPKGKRLDQKKVEEAELLRNSYLKVDRNDEPELEEGVYYIVDLLGLEVYSDEGKLLGKVDDIYNNGSTDIYVVKDELGKQLLLPAIADVIKEISLEDNKIVVHLLKGLI